MEKGKKLPDRVILAALGYATAGHFAASVVPLPARALAAFPLPLAHLPS